MKLPSASQAAEAHAAQLRVLQSMTPEERLREALDLSDFVRALFREGLRRRFPDLSEDDFNALFLKRLKLCHNSNY